MVMRSLGNRLLLIFPYLLMAYVYGYGMWMSPSRTIIARIGSKTVSMADFYDYVRTTRYPKAQKEMPSDKWQKEMLMAEFLDNVALTAMAESDGITRSKRFEKAVALMELKLLARMAIELRRAKRKPEIETYCGELAYVGASPVLECDFQRFLKDAFLPSQSNTVHPQKDARRRLPQSLVNMRALAEDARNRGLHQSRTFLRDSLLMKQQLLFEFVRKKHRVKLTAQFDASPSFREKNLRQFFDSIRLEVGLRVN